MAPGKGVAKAKGKAKAKARPGRKSLTAAQLANQKLRENFKQLPEHCKFVKILEGTGRTLKEQIEYDVAQKAQGADIVFGLTYYADRAKEYSADDSYFVALKPAAEDESVVSDGCISATLSIKLLKIFYYYYYYYCFLDLYILKDF